MSMMTITAVAGVGSDDCGATSVIPYTFTAMDDCGNTTIAIANVTIVDNTAPSISVAADITVNCDDAEPFTWVATAATGMDDCGMVTITNSLVSLVEACAGNAVYTFALTATDDCGNSTTETTTYTTVDNEGPVFNDLPDDLTISCGNDNALLVNAWLEDIETEDHCAGTAYSIENDFDGTLPDLCGGTTTVTWTLTDDCGNVTTAQRDIIVDPETDGPQFNVCPADVTVNLDPANCGTSTVTFAAPIAEDCNGPVVITQTSGIMSGTMQPVGTYPIEYSATDACGNTSLCMFNVEVVNNTTPNIVCPSDVTVCNDDTECFYTGTDGLNANLIENCDMATLTYDITGATTMSGTGSVSGIQFQLGLSMVEYTITSPAGTAMCTFNITVEDCENPTITCPADLSIECFTDDATAELATFLGSAITDDNCDTDVDVTTTELVETPLCNNTTSTLYQFTATDDAGNSEFCFANFTIEDTTAPVLMDGTDVTVECDGNGNSTDLSNFLSSNGGLSIADVTEECGEAVTFSNNFPTPFISAPGCNSTAGYYDVDFMVQDDCGNVSNSVTVRFTIEDTTDPMITPPADISVECGSDANTSIINSWLTTYTASDACSDVTVTNDFTAAPSTCEAGMNMTTVTFTALDECENMATTTATITVVDTEKPVIMVTPTDLIVECPAADQQATIDAWVDTFGGGSAVDNCDTDVMITFTAGTAVSECGGTSITPYTFVAADDCGNDITTTAYLRIIDTTSPTLTLPNTNNSEDCDGPVGATLSTWLNSASAVDDCGMASVTYALVSEIETCNGTNTEITSTYLFTATDACGNASTGQSTFVIEDETAPVITAPADLTIACGDDVSGMLVSWLDDYIVVEACQDFTVTNNYSGTVPSLCAGGPTTVTWTVVDGCGAMSTATADITVSPDMMDPTFVNCPSDMTVNVDVDNCTSNVIYSIPVAEDCNGIMSVTRTSGLASGATFPLGDTDIVYTATDDCGNTITCEFTITVIDSDTPSISCPSSDVVVCNTGTTCTWLSNASITPTTADNCMGSSITHQVTGATTIAANTAGIIANNTAFNIGTSVVTYTITDAAGNTATCSFNVIVEDCTAPVITCPADLTLECGATTNAAAITTWLSAPSVTATDNCPTAMTAVTVTNAIIAVNSQCGETSTTIYEFTATAMETLLMLT